MIYISIDIYQFFVFADHHPHQSSISTLFYSFWQGSVRNGLVSRDDWKSIPWGVVCEFISLMDSQTMPGQHTQATLTLLGQVTDIAAQLIVK